jgi:hypothetical protein
MFRAIVLNFVSIVVLAGGWTLAVRAVYKGLAPPAAGQDTPRLSHTGHLPDIVLEAKRAA